MSTSKRMVIWLVVLAVLLIVITVWSRDRMITARDRARDAAQNLDGSRLLINQIVILRDDRAVRADRPDRDREVIGLIERSASEAGIERTALARISPEPPRRVADTGYAEHRVQVAMRQVGLGQLLRFLREAADEGRGLRARSIQITAPQGSSPNDLWNADTTFAYLSNTASPSTGAQTGP